MSHNKKFISVMRSGFNRWHTWQVFADFVELAAIAIRNQMTVYDEELEQRYLKTIGRYDSDEAFRMCELLAITQIALERPHDFLGGVFQELELSSHWKGQFFTPYDLCLMVASLSMGDVREHVEQKGYVTLHEPACGSGAIVIAAAEVMREAGLPPETTLVADLTDNDQTAAYMAYVQLSTLGIPAVVRVGNTLTMKYRETWYTPATAVFSADHKNISEVRV